MAFFSHDVTMLVPFLVLLGCGISVVVPAYCVILAKFSPVRLGVTNATVDHVARAIGTWLLTLSVSLTVPGLGFGASIGLLATMAAVLCVLWLRIDRSVSSGDAVTEAFKVLTSRTAVGTILVFFGYSCSLNQLLVWNPVVLREIGLAPAPINTLNVLFLSTLAVSGVFWGWLADTRGRQSDSVRLLVRKRLVIAGLLVSGLTGVIPYAVPAAMGSLFFFSLLSLACIAAVSPNLWALVQTTAPVRTVGRWAGLQVSFGTLGVVVSSYLMEKDYGSLAIGRVSPLISVVTALTGMLLIRAQQKETSTGSNR
jgi:hypothetical protein